MDIHLPHSSRWERTLTVYTNNTHITNVLILVFCRQDTVDVAGQEEEEEALRNGGVLSAKRNSRSSEGGDSDSGVGLKHETPTSSLPTFTPKGRTLEGRRVGRPRPVSPTHRDFVVGHADFHYNGAGNHERDTGNGTGTGSGSGEYHGRRHSVAVDSTGHLRVPTPSDNASSTTSSADGQLRSADTSNYDSMSPGTSPPSAGGARTDGPKAAANLRTRHAPQIIYSYSEDRLLASDAGSRPICPGLPYSPYGSPSGSPRLQRQPTRETRRLSITDSDGYTVLNQYKLKDEIGKVRL